MRPTVGQYFPMAPISVFRPDGNAATSREYLRSHSERNKSALVCGANLSGDSSIVNSPASISAISALIETIALINLSNSLKSSDSVGSIIKVPATGKLTVGAWNP